MDTTYWQRKIVALLHDPPDKALKIGGHKDRAKILMQFALRGLPDVPPTGIPDDAWINSANLADTIAAAADRINFPGYEDVEVLDWAQHPNSRITHPLSGQQMSLSINVSPEQSHNAQAEAIRSLSDKTSDPKDHFLLLWRFLEEELYRQNPNLPWELLPADTRIPDHSLLHHNRVVSAFAVIDKPATLVFSIGPVQSFIATARKTRDLWMGSYLLSYLIWQAIKVIADELGPDHVLFPSLIGQPLADLWLQERSGLAEKPLHDQIHLATLPNRFFAVVPAEQAEELAKRGEEKLKSEWRQLAEKVWKKLCNGVPDFKKAEPIWDRQLEQFPEVYWAIYKWDTDHQAIAERFRNLTGSNRFDQWLTKMKEIGVYEPNQGSVYAACYELTERALGALKTLRNFYNRTEPAGKCSLCGERQALSDLTGQLTRNWREQEKKFWRKVAEKFPGDVDADGSECLCALCTVKRFAAKFFFSIFFKKKEKEFVFEEKSKIPINFPSTDSVAAATFVKALLEQWDKAKEPVRELICSIGIHKQGAWKKVAFVGMGIPKLERKASQLGGEAEKLMQLDGEWLFAESYDPERIRRAHNIEVDDEVAQRLREKVLLKQLYEIARPRDYYAVLLMDGDGMGKWLSGIHEGLGTFKEILHPKVIEQVKDKSDWRNLLEQKRLVSPSLHAAISQALANFALCCVPFVVEGLHCGRLVYAGGDDVLALFPIDEVLVAAHELRAFFSGEAERKPEGSVEVEFGSDKWTGWIDWDGRKLLTMGNKATASIGIVIVHRLHPLRNVLTHVREAEEKAKEQYGRNAICVRWLKRSGEQVQMGAKFFYLPNINNTLQVLLGFAELMRTKISRGFATDLMQESFALVGLSKKAQEAELRRLLKRRSQNLFDEQINEWAQKLAHLAVALDTHAVPDTDPFDLTHPQGGIIELAKWLTFLRFLVGGGE